MATYLWGGGFFFFFFFFFSGVCASQQTTHQHLFAYVKSKGIILFIYMTLYLIGWEQGIMLYIYIYMTLYLIRWGQGIIWFLCGLRMHYICMHNICMHSTSRVTNIVHKFDHDLKCGVVVCTSRYTKRDSLQSNLSFLFFSFFFFFHWWDFAKHEVKLKINFFRKWSDFGGGWGGTQ